MSNKRSWQEAGIETVNPEIKRSRLSYWSLYFAQEPESRELYVLTLYNEKLSDATLLNEHHRILDTYPELLNHSTDIAEQVSLRSDEDLQPITKELLLSEDYDTVGRYASYRNYSDMLEFVITVGLCHKENDWTDPTGESMVMCAAQDGCLESLKVLIKHGHHLNLVQSNTVPILEAYRGGMMKCVSELYGKVDISVSDRLDPESTREMLEEIL